MLDDVQVGDTWHFRLPGASAVSTGFIFEKTGATVLIRHHKFSAYGSRYVTAELEWFIERIERSAAPEGS
ncbi:hypothetical protein AB4Y43_01045 [Paraburkholderia sp. BR10872]|uniref:hypothetical protein n=1 Tax=Paraburkholderia sp. BR10872 TaxID=3236989 RepID=UPI0034D27C31